jgi:hypothetical protein
MENKVKNCSKCKLSKSFSEFYSRGKNEKGRDRGLEAECKKCSKLRKSTYYNSHKQEHLKAGRKYYYNNKEKYKATRKIYLSKKENIDRMIAYRKKNKDNRNYILKHVFNMSREEYNSLLKMQHESCAICKRHYSNFKKALAVDHDHKTGKNRGLLCGNCNIILGHLKDIIKVVENLKIYLQEHETNS